MKDWKYILYISLAFGLFVAVKLLSPKQYNWTVTLAHEDKNPYGAYALGNLLPGIFPDSINHSYETFYEIKDSLKRVGSILSISSNFSAGSEDTEALLKHVEGGGSAFISSQYFWGALADTLDVSTYNYFFEEANSLLERKDTSYIHFVNPALDTASRYYFRRDNIHNYFNQFDTTRTSVIARNDRGNPVTIRIRWGKGNIILNSTPLAFTNIYLLSKDNNRFVSTSLSYLPQTPLQWTEYYHVGRMEASTPLRFVLSNKSLSWAYYVTIITLLLFMIFEMKRKQRIIPIITPLANTTLEFVGTIGNLYFQNKEHKNIAEKKILFFLEQIRSKYYLSTTKLDDYFIHSLSKKSGKDESEIRGLLNTVKTIQSKPKIGVDLLIDLNKRLEKFTNVL